MIFISFFSLMLVFFSPQNFRDEQKKFPRVREAYAEKEIIVNDLLRKKGIDPQNFSMLIQVFKKERTLQVWAKSKDTTRYQLIQTYKICALSGNLGPKRKQGDSQVPEGFYYISLFNPSSSFYLSLGINYPNDADHLLGDKENPGGDIFIHGSCVTIGCMPMTNDKIKEIYLMAVEARTNGQLKIPVYIFPCVMDDDGMKFLERTSIRDSSLMPFWKNLQEGYLQFEEKNKALFYSVNSSGKYIFESN